MSNQRFYICKTCGNLVCMIDDSGANPVCCGNPMTELVPNTVDAAQEKHLPSLTMSPETGLTVQVGSVPHPMTEEHHIEFVYVQTEKGGQMKKLEVGAEPKCTFRCSEDKPVAVYAYCNLHGLWKTEI